MRLKSVPQEGVCASTLSIPFLLHVYPHSLPRAQGSPMVRSRPDSRPSSTLVMLLPTPDCVQGMLQARATAPASSPASHVWRPSSVNHEAGRWHRQRHGFSVARFYG
jgi:hypothetical protein